jgi:hypothetical protein
MRREPAVPFNNAEGLDEEDNDDTIITTMVTINKFDLISDEEWMLMLPLLEDDLGEPDPEFDAAFDDFLKDFHS